MNCLTSACDKPRILTPPTRAANREKFAAAAAAAPESFSSLQMATYLKASRFKQEIEGYKRVIGGAADAGIGEGRRIASETGREFIFVRADGTSLSSAGARGAGAGGFLGRGGRGKGRGRKQELAPIVAPPPPMRVDSAKLASKIRIAAFKLAGSEGEQGEEEEEQLLLSSPLRPPLHLLQGLGKVAVGSKGVSANGAAAEGPEKEDKEDKKEEVKVRWTTCVLPSITAMLSWVLCVAFWLLA